MNRNVRILIATCAIAFSMPAAAQLVALQDRPLSAAERTRMTVLEAQFSRISAQRNTSFAALRTIARALGGKLTALAPEQVLKIVDDRAQELVKARGRIQEMQGQLDQLDSMKLAKAVGPLLDSAKVAIDEGRLSDADGQLAQAAARFGEVRGNLQSQVDSIGAQEADVLAQQGGVRNSLSDFAGAATLYAKAADLSEKTRPEIAWGFRSEQATALYYAGLEGKADGVADAIAVLRHKALPLAPRDTRPVDFSATQFKIGSYLLSLASKSADEARAREAVDALRLSVATITPATSAQDRVNRRSRLGSALGYLGIFANDAKAVEEAVAVMARTEAEDHPDTADFYSDYANVLGALSGQQGQTGDRDAAIATGLRMIAMFDKALARTDRDARPGFYAQTQFNLAAVYLLLVEPRYDQALIDKGIAVTKAGLTTTDRVRIPLYWHLLQFNLGSVRIIEADHQAPVDLAKLTEGLTALDLAAQFLTRADFPRFFRQIQFYRGVAYSLQARTHPTPERFAAAIGALREAADLYAGTQQSDQQADSLTRLGMLHVAAALTKAGADRRVSFDTARALYAEVAPLITAPTNPEIKARLAAAVAQLKAAEKGRN